MAGLVSAGLKKNRRGWRENRPEGTALANAALTNVQSSDSAWLTQQTTLADADEAESITETQAQAGLLDAQAAADATLTNAAAAEQSGVAASLAADAAIIAAGDSASTTPLLPTPAAPLAVANLAIGSPSLPSQPATDTFYQNAMAGPAYGFSFVPQTSYNDPGNLNEDLTLSSTETAVRAPLIYDQGGTNNPGEVAAVAITPPTGETYSIANLADGGGSGGGTTNADGNIWTPSAGDINAAFLAGSTSKTVSPAAAPQAGGWNGISGAAPAVDYGTTNATVSTLLDDGSHSAVVRQVADNSSSDGTSGDQPMTVHGIPIQGMDADGKVWLAIPNYPEALPSTTGSAAPREPRRGTRRRPNGERTRKTSPRWRTIQTDGWRRELPRMSNKHAS